MKFTNLINNKTTRFFSIVLLMSNTYSLTFAGEKLNSAEIKKVRHISQALLQSRALEKKRIDSEVSSQRADLKIIEKSIDELISSVNYSSSKMVIQKQQVDAINASTLNLVGMTPKIFNLDGTPIRNPVIPQASHLAATKFNADTNNIQVIKREKLTQKNTDITEKSMKVIEKVRASREKKSPVFFAFWKKKTDQDIRNERIVNTAENAKQKLSQMMVDQVFDVQNLKILKNKLRLKKHSTKAERQQPSIQTRTRHRVQ